MKNNNRWVMTALVGIMFPLACTLWTAPAVMQAPRPTATATATNASIDAFDTPAPEVYRLRYICTVTASEALNLRSGLGTGYAVIGYLSPGDKLTITQRRDGWANVKTPTGAAGWVNLTYCKSGE